MGFFTAACRVTVAAAFAATSLAFAQAPSKPQPDDTPHFEIRRFIFDGASLIPKEELESATAAFTGPNRTFGDVQHALEVLERAYSDAGYNAVQIILPEQELERGEIRFQIIEAKIGRVLVEGNKHFDEANIRASVPSLAPGNSPNIHEISRNLRVANENPAKQATVLLRSGQEEATVDAVLRVVDEAPTKYSVTVDNTGNPQTGRLRVGLGVQNANATGHDDVFTAQYVTAPYTDFVKPNGEVTRLSLLPSRKVTILGAGYRIPLYRVGDSIDFSAGYSNVNSGTVAGLFNITGRGSIYGARYTRNFDKIGDYEHRLALSADYRSYENKGVRLVGDDTNTQLIPDIVVHPITVLYSGLLRLQDSETGFSVGYSRNIPGGPDGRSDNFCRSRNNGIGRCADANYEIYKWAFNHNRALPADWQMRVAMNGQYTREMLVTGEQFGLGGADSVRGFFEREITNDKGYRGTVELYTPDFGGWTGVTAARSRGLVFFDWGGVRRNQPGPAEPHGTHVWSTGVGLRLSRGTNFAFRVDVGIVGDEGGAQTRGDSRMHASVSYIF
ncbi:MAG: ShlB/FhaC/HecB family hemolysin secretion/activation protein [Betaproteobacteria bacterium]|nr:MAG: ShlB/FhaC/HecB family hemolysin secretion/activation protein [Betaproteobacteria bacterium]